MRLVPLFLATLLAFAAIAVRAAFAPAWTWLAFNLVLAWVPVVLGRLAARRPAGLLVLGIPWLLFLPNAPYLLTDLVHLKSRAAVPMWFDVALLGGCGALGLALGVRSVEDVASALPRRVGVALRLVVPALCGYAIWLGRFERWNSWDLFLRPGAVLAEVLPTFLRPFDHPRTWAVTLTYGLVILAAGVLAVRQKELVQSR